MRTIQSLTIDFGIPEGDYRYHLDEDGSELIGGTPFPSEGQAHSFGIFVKAVQELANWPLADLEHFVGEGRL